MKKIVYHGRKDGLPDNKEPPIFFTDNKEDAKWYAYERGSYSEKPVITETTIKIERAASLEDLNQAVVETGATREDIIEHSPYEGYNEIDYLYVPEVREILKGKGFDNFQGWDVLTNMEIPVTVIFDKDQIINKIDEIIEENTTIT